LLTFDSSIVIAALDSTHPDHEPVIAFVEEAGEVQLVAHVALETYHVLTRVRPYRRLGPNQVMTAIRSTFSKPLIDLPSNDYWTLIEKAPQLGIVGGAIYDAFIGMTAKRAGLQLVSRDLRAAATYSKLGVNCRLLSPCG
jgi:predicted nucleic acid-binding protein